MDQKRILIVEDDLAVAKGLKYVLSQEGFSVSWADSGEKAYQLLKSFSPHLIVLDVRLPDINGFDFCRSIRSNGFQQPILMLTARDEEVDKVLGFEFGADDYVVKPYKLRELISRIRALLRRAYGSLSNSTESEKFIFDDVIIDFKLLQVYKDESAVVVTPTEMRLLRYFVSNVDRILTREQILNAVWGYQSGISYDKPDDIRTVDVHIRHLREKLEEDPNNPKRILTVRGFGYKFSYTG